MMTITEEAVAFIRKLHIAQTVVEFSVAVRERFEYDWTIMVLVDEGDELVLAAAPNDTMRKSELPILEDVIDQTFAVFGIPFGCLVNTD